MSAAMACDSRLVDAFYKGQSASRQNLPASVNPHHPRQDLYNAWHEGWLYEECPRYTLPNERLTPESR